MTSSQSSSAQQRISKEKRPSVIASAASPNSGSIRLAETSPPPFGKRCERGIRRPAGCSRRLFGTRRQGRRGGDEREETDGRPTHTVESKRGRASGRPSFEGLRT